METIYFVYLLTFSNGKVYVGMSKTDKRGLFTLRYNNHANQARKGKSLPIYHAWRKHGAPTQEILSKHASREACAAAEIAAIAARKATDPEHGYNLMRGGEGLHAPKGSIMHALMMEKVWRNPERIRKVSKALKGRVPSQQALAASAEARKDNPEWRAKMQANAWGNPTLRAAASERTRLQMANGGAAHIARLRKLRPYRPSPEQNARQAEKMKEFMKTPEGNAIAKRGYVAMLATPGVKEKQQAGQDAWRASEKNKANCVAMAQKSAVANRKKVRDKETGVLYSSQREMAASLGVSEAVISLRVKAGKIDRV